jgi:predicted  nucleic acid-binding Zn-ribbon protein
LTDLSAGGMTLRRAENLNLGAVVEFELFLSDADTPLTLRGEVVGNHGTEARVRFTGGQESALADLRQLIEGEGAPALDPGAPTVELDGERLEEQLAAVKAETATKLAERDAALERAQGELKDLADQHRASHLRIAELEQKVAALARGKARARARQEEAAAGRDELESDARRLQEEWAQLESERRSLERQTQSLEARSEALRQQAAEIAEQREAVDTAYRLLEETTAAASERLGAEEAEVLRGQAWVERERKNLEQIRVELNKREAELQAATGPLVDATQTHPRRSGGAGHIGELDGTSSDLAGDGLATRLGTLWDSYRWLIIVAAVILAALLTATVMPAWIAPAPGHDEPIRVERTEP